MWLRDEVLYPRFLRSLLWMIFLQYMLINGCLLSFKIISWHPLGSIGDVKMYDISGNKRNINIILCFPLPLKDWILCIFHWRSILYLGVLSTSIAAFGILNMQYFSVEKHINTSRFERICRSLSPFCLQHILSTMALGGLAAYCYVNLFQNFQDKSAFIFSWLSSINDFEQSFIIGHGCFTGLMFSLKYFICNMYLVKFSLDQKLKIHSVMYQMPDLLKESFFCVVKAIHWYYLTYLILGSPLKILTFSFYNSVHSENESIFSIIVNVKLFFICTVTGVAISYIWSLYLTVFNALATETYKFPITLPVKGDKKITLSSALASKESDYLKHLAALDLRFLSQFEPQRREQIFAISHPGGHPHEWKAVSGVCIALLQEFVYRLNEYSFTAAAVPESKSVPSQIPKENITLNGVAKRPVQGLPEKAYCYLRKKPAISYFFDELPNAKLMKLFASSQPFTWIVDALGYLVAISYNEDKYGVVQQTLPEIIRLLLDIKMAEEKMPVGLVGIRTYVRDPQGRYDHIHQRLSLKTTVNNALSRIANTFDQNINGIYLPEEYQKYFERYLDKKN